MYMKKIIFLFFFGALFVGGYAQGSLSNPWNITGNANTSDRNFLGTTDNSPLIFKTQGIERMRLLYDKSFLGIGTTEPQAPLHLNFQIDPIFSLGDTTDPRMPPVPLMKITGPGMNNGFNINCFPYTGRIDLVQKEQGDLCIFGSASSLLLTSSGSVEVSLASQAMFYVGGAFHAEGSLSAQSANITGNTYLNGYVGIGTNLPNQKLHIVDGNILISKTSSAKAPGSTNGSILFGADINSNTIPAWGIEYLNSDDPVNGGYGLNFWKPHGPGQGLMNHVLFVADNGRVGIGKNNPLAKLDVAGSFRAESVNITGNLTVQKANMDTISAKMLSVQGATYLNGKLGVGTNNPLEQMQIGSIWTFHNGGTKYIGRNVTYASSENVRIEQGAVSLLSFSDGSISLETAESGPAGSSVNTIEKNLTLTAIGNVGIGTKIPKAKLDVIGSFRAQSANITGALTVQKLNVNDTIFVKVVDAQKANLTGSLNAQSANIAAGLNAQDAYIDRYLTTEKLYTTDATIYNNLNAERLYASRATITGLLDVQKMRIEEVLCVNEIRVRNPSCWPDYVFEEDYKLLSLSEVEQYIQQNKRLPEIPSAREAEENGIDLGDMQVKLLLKIEELTLYILDLQKQIDELKKR